MAQKKGNPGCPCCESICLIQSNDLDNDADLDNNFTLSDGDKFAYHGDPFSAIQISGASETATANTPHPQSPYPPRVQIEFYGDQISSQPRVILGGKIVAQITIGDDCSQLDILNEADDSEICQTLWMPGIDRNEWHRLTVCYDPDTGVVKATVTDLTDSVSYNLSCEYSGDALDATAAFGTGPSHVDNVYVRNFRFWRLWYCGDSPHTEDCHIEGDAWDYYYELPERTPCYTCTMACEVASDDFTTMNDGPMPCTWDAVATDWEVVSGAATGNGEVCHTFDTTGGYYSVSATFYLGYLETVGDSVTVALSIDTTVHSLTITKGVGGYNLTWLPAGFGSYLVIDYPGTVTLTTCATSLCNSLRSVSLYRSSPAEGRPCVSITQPTLSGHVDASLTAFEIKKTIGMHEDCDPCCPATCVNCTDPNEWPSMSVAQVDGLVINPAPPVINPVFPCPECPDWNGAYYLSAIPVCMHEGGTSGLTCDGVTWYQVNIRFWFGECPAGPYTPSYHPYASLVTGKWYLFCRIVISPVTGAYNAQALYYFALPWDDAPIDCSLLPSPISLPFIGDISYSTYPVLLGGGWNDDPGFCHWDGSDVEITLL